MDDIVAQFMAFTNSDAESAQQYLEASDLNLETAVELYFASGGASAASQQAPAASGGSNDDVRERIEGFDDQLVDEEAQFYNEWMRNTRKAEARARKPRGIFNQDRGDNLESQRLSKHERRLANLFRPPFDLISDISLDDAKTEAQEQGKFVMVNVQDSGEFSCQRLNRDLWRHQQVKDLVSENFVFLQFDADDPDGEDYRVLYPFDSFPHIAIIDAWTGEQQKVWPRVPTEAEFMEDVFDFLASAQRVPPTINNDDHDEADGAAQVSTDENAQSAPRQSDASAAAATTPGTSAGPHAPEEPSKEPEDVIAAMAPIDEAEPAPGPETTRIQLRYGDGNRTVRRFLLSDPVDKVYAVVKHVLGVSGTISLAADRRDLRSDLGKTVEEANLKNSTVLVETD